MQWRPSFPPAAAADANLHWAVSANTVMKHEKYAAGKPSVGSTRVVIRVWMALTESHVVYEEIQNARV